VHGNVVWSGSTPQSITGLDGDFYMDHSTSFSNLYGPRQNDTWSSTINLFGATGVTGVHGNVVWSGSTPQSITGLDGDFYMHHGTAFSNLYGPRQNNTWSSTINLFGATGARGIPGNIIWSGTDPVTTATDGDFYLKRDTSTLYGPRVGGAWSSTYNLIGQTGATGVLGNVFLQHPSSDPSGAVGGNGDYFFRTDVGKLFGPKSGGLWPSGVLLLGATGATGTMGNAIYFGTQSAGSLGSVGYSGDFYINTARTAMYGPKSGSTWPSTNFPDFCGKARAVYVESGGTNPSTRSINCVDTNRSSLFVTIHLNFANLDVWFENSNDLLLAGRSVTIFLTYTSSAVNSAAITGLNGQNFTLRNENGYAKAIEFAAVKNDTTIVWQVTRIMY
jgi:hypothetical protein